LSNAKGGHVYIEKKWIEDLFKRHVASVAVEREFNDEFQMDLKFLQGIDDPKNHNPDWHEWGVVTHTLMAVEYFLQSDFSGIPIGNRDLFVTAIYLHDIGKSHRVYLRGDDGNIDKVKFTGHEKKSGEIVRSDESIREHLKLSDADLEYVARVCETHYELGKLREVGKKSPGGYSRDFISSDIAVNTMREIAQNNKDVAYEIGVFFIVDSMAKTRFRPIKGETEEEFEYRLKCFGAGKNIYKSALQIEDNIYLAEKYFEILKESKNG
jgi:hypothetical protein